MDKKEILILQPNINQKKRFELYRLICMVFELKISSIETTTTIAIQNKNKIIGLISEISNIYYNLSQFDDFDTKTHLYLYALMNNLIKNIKKDESPIINVIANLLLKEFEYFLTIEERFALSAISSYPTKENLLKMMEKIGVYK